MLFSASVDGKVVVWKIDEGTDEENKPQITGKIVIAIQIVGDGESYHPRICWHSHKQVMPSYGCRGIVSLIIAHDFLYLQILIAGILLPLFQLF